MYRFKCQSMFPLLNIWAVVFLTLGISVKYFSWTCAKTFFTAVAWTDWNSLGIHIFHKYFTREVSLAQNSPFSIASHLHLHFTQVPRMGLWSNSCSLRYYCCTFSFPFFGRGGNWRIRGLTEPLPSYNPLCRAQAEKQMVALKKMLSSNSKACYSLMWTSGADTVK